MKPVFNQVYQIIKKFWLKIINVGIDGNTSLFDRKRVRLINGIGFISAIFYFINFFRYTYALPMLYECPFAMCFNLVPIFINYKKKYALACHYYCSMNILWYFYLAVTAGAIDNADFIYVPSSVAAMIFFREFSITAVYFILNFVCFGLVRYSHTIIKPLYHFRGQENLALSNYFTMFFMVFLIVNYFRSENSRQEGALEERNVKLHDEKERSDGLLLNILPAETAEELKATGKAKAKSFEMVTIMFTDFKNFTKASETMSPEELVSEINYCYSEFDRIVSDYKVEKIKTIGDGYMAAGGLPVENVSNPEDTIMAALEIRNFMMIEKQKRMSQDKPYFDIRIGIHTGPVVAGIVGIRKFAYDIWGDAVNTASRMESSGEPGKVNISGSTYELVRDKFTFDYRGKVMAKNKGEIDMYFVEA